ncbi:hypothetical protein MHBO_001076 [Bonamia ostreae]|uniref:Uncharacterized protein n=1 Tax=Bonamia ostreae TaxID=126728 RepID=A0ABV2AHS4_9EUKA
MLFSRFASKFGINVHVMRLTVLCVIVYPEDLSFHTLTTLSKAGEPDNLALIVLEYIFLLAIPFYVVALWMNKVGTMSGNRDAVANSFLADWESSYEFKGAEKRKLSVFTVFVFISNTVFVFYFLFFLADFKMAENTFHTDWRDNVSLIMPVVTLLIYMADMLYNLFRRMRNSYIYRSFFYLGLFVAYFCLEMHIDLLSNAMVSSAAPKPSAWNFSDGFYAEGWNWGGAMKVLWLYLAIFMSFNFALMLFYHSTTLISLTFFVIKWMFSLGGIAAILSIGGILLVLIGFALSAYSYMQSYFYSYLTLEKSFKAFLDMMKAIKDVVMAFLSGFSDIANALNKVTGGYFCIVLIGVTILVAILVLIGFGVGVASMLMKKLFELLQMLFKVIRSIRNLQDVFTNIYTFTKKSEAMQDSASTSSVSKMKQGSTIYYFMVLLGMLITIGGIVTVYFYAAERYLEVSRPVFVMTLFIIEILLLAYLGFIYVTEYIFSQNYDLVIMFLRILPGYGILYTKISLILVCLGVALILASYAIGYSSGWMRNSNFFDEMDVETFVWPSFERLCCPLVASPRGRQHDDNACATLCNRLCCCFDKKVDQINDGDTSAKFVKYIFCPCTEDLNPVYDDTRVANLFANFVCCCFYDGKFQRSWNPIKICFCVPNFGKVAKMKNQLDNTFDVSVVANNKIEESHLNYYEIKTRMTKDRYNKAKHFRPIIPESAEKTTGFSLDAKTMAKLKGPPLPPGLLGSFGFWQVLKEIFQNGFNKFAQYLIPILMHGITLYIMYKALTNTWVLVSFKSDSVFSSVLSDTSTESTSDHVTEVERNKKSMCPVLDLINFIKNLMIKLIFAVLKSVFPRFYAQIISF